MKPEQRLLLPNFKLQLVILLESQPTRILSLSPTATEILCYALDQVIAVDDQSNYPPEAPTSIFQVLHQPRRILALEPDLLFIRIFRRIEQGLSNVGIPSLTQYAAAALMTLTNNSIGISYRSKCWSRKYGSGNATENMSLWLASMLLSSSLTFTKLDPTYFSVTSSTFIGQVYAMLGLTNIADEAEGGSGYPQLQKSTSFTNPDLIF